MTERTWHDDWDEQAHEDFAAAMQALALAAVRLDEQAMSWDGIAPGEARQLLKQLRGMLDFADASVEATTGLTRDGVSGS